MAPRVGVEPTSLVLIPKARWCVDRDSNYGEHRPERRNAALDREHAKDDRAASRDDRVALTEDDDDSDAGGT